MPQSRRPWASLKAPEEPEGSLIEASPSHASSPSMGSRAKPKGDDIHISPLEESDIAVFMELQDMFAKEHLCMTQKWYRYSTLTLQHWQTELLCPTRILTREGGRREHIRDMIKKEKACFQSLHILKAVRQKRGQPERMIGFIMYMVMPGDAKAKGGSSRGKRGGPWLHLKHLFVLPNFRNRGCAGMLLSHMWESADPQGVMETHIGVLELNSVAFNLYRRLGFITVALNPDYLGPPELAQVVVFLEMKRPPKTAFEIDAAMLAPSPLFEEEIIGEHVVVDYGNEEVYEVKVVGVVTEHEGKSCYWHTVDSRPCGGKLRAIQPFTDVLNLTDYFQRGLAFFMRPFAFGWKEKLAQRNGHSQASSLAGGGSSQGSIAEPQPSSDLDLAEVQQPRKRRRKADTAE
eukprot:CAMPEP_0178446636 /NCGR_PEP_ID=MMETSP0689_2-20121128/40924_1 /TAXON_ID=160604 /ORGANISM="Amphidinium massartii, Strain CS-259" /LENGTH=402 /DNA_ID=CAMNT_0020071503 /DNA_START=78 /DNA_END=1283 /DNA_ORIENTATION=+